MSEQERFKVPVGIFVLLHQGKAIRSCCNCAKIVRLADLGDMYWMILRNGIKKKK